MATNGEATNIAKTAVYDQIDGKISSVKEILSTRIDAIDEATKVFQDNLTRVPTEVDKRVGQLDQLFCARLEAIRLEIQTRINAIEQATELLREISMKMPSEADKGLTHLQEICDEKFSSIAIQFKERDTRTESTQKDSKVAVDAALQAAKEAVGEQNRANALSIAKSEGAFTKQIDQTSSTITLLQKNFDDKIEDLKERIRSNEQSAQTFQSLTEGRSKGAGDLWGYIAGGIGLLIAAVTVVVMSQHGK
jgi:hypothetical protein